MRPVTPLLTVDAIIELPDGKIVLVNRKYPPLGWAIPGGFVDPGESLAEAVRREAFEETALDIEVVGIFNIYSKPWRDPRGDTVSVVYYCTADGLPEGGDDAAAAVPFHPEEFPSDLVFDHGKILDQFMEWKRTGKQPSVEE